MFLFVTLVRMHFAPRTLLTCQSEKKAILLAKSDFSITASDFVQFRIFLMIYSMHKHFCDFAFLKLSCMLVQPEVD